MNTRSLTRRTTGVERYTAEVVRRLEGRLRSASPGRLRLPGIGHVWEQSVLPRRLNRGELLWSPANSGPLAVTNQVLTLHDINVLENPSWFSPPFAAWYRWFLPRLVHRVRRVLTVSEHSRQRIAAYFSIPPERVVAIPGGVDREHFHPSSAASVDRVRQRYRLGRDYLLFTGTLEPRKNLPRLFEAWRVLYEEFPQIELVIAGGTGKHFSSQKPSVSQITPESGVRYLGYVPEADLPPLYSGARAFIYPSLAEGFGLPVLEAMACGAPVVASRAGALPETAGEAAWLVDPANPAGLVEAVRELLRSPDCRAEYRRRGLEHAQKYSWNETAERVWQELWAASQEGG